MQRLEISGKLLARNAGLNFVGQTISLLVGLASIPFIVRGLGIERFGLLALAWVILGSFSAFDLGLGRATTKFAAEALGSGKADQISGVVWTAATSQFILGLLGALLLAGITPVLVERILHIPRELVAEARGTFYLLALAIPVVLVSGSFSGALEATQRFDLVNAIRVPSNLSTYLLALLGVTFDLQLPGILALLLIARIASLSALLIIAVRVFPSLGRFSAQRVVLPRLLNYGAWIAVSAAVGPLLVYLDRFLIATILTVGAVAYYSAPHEIVARLSVIPMSLMMSLFPAFSALEGIRDRERVGKLFRRSVKYVLLAMSPIVLVMFLFAREILQVWLGSDFARQSTTVTQILLLGALVNSLANTPYALLQGVGRPDIPAKFHILELVPYGATAWILVSRWGVTGAAAAWTMRVTTDAVLLFWAALRIYRLSPRFLVSDGLAQIVSLFWLLTGAVYAFETAAGLMPLAARSALLAAFLGISLWIAWARALDPSERATFLKRMTAWWMPGSRQ